MSRGRTHPFGVTLSVAKGLGSLGHAGPTVPRFFAPLRMTILIGLIATAGCVSTNPEQRAAEAKDLFERTVREFHLPAAEAQGAARDKLLAQAAAGYEQLLRQHPNESFWCAQALRSLGNVRAEQDRLDEAVKLYRQVGERYPQQDWEVLQAWKSAADLLWDAGRREEARAFYQPIATRFDTADAPAVYQTIVKAAKNRL